MCSFRSCVVVDDDSFESPLLLPFCFSSSTTSFFFLLSFFSYYLAHARKQEKNLKKHIIRKKIILHPTCQKDRTISIPRVNITSPTDATAPSAQQWPRAGWQICFVAAAAAPGPSLSLDCENTKQTDQRNGSASYPCSSCIHVRPRWSSLFPSFYTYLCPPGHACDAAGQSGRRCAVWILPTGSTWCCRKNEKERKKERKKKRKKKRKGEENQVLNKNENKKKNKSARQKEKKKERNQERKTTEEEQTKRKTKEGTTE